jgi:subtilisin family serine protease
MTIRKRKTLALLAGVLAISGTLHSQEREPAIHPLLREVLERPEAPLSPVLRSPLGGGQGRQRLGGQEALSLHLRTTASRESLETMGVHVRSMRGGRATVTLLPAVLPALVARPDTLSVSLPRPLKASLNKSVPDTGITTLRSQSGGVFSGAAGAGAIVAVVDSGIDVDHPNFKDAGGNTRILYLWDQENAPNGAGGVPAPYNYGTEWTAADIDAGLSTEHDEVSQFGHGTHVTGIAAGNGAAADENGIPYSHVGVAPASPIIFVKVGFGEGFTDHLIDALNYIFAKADALGMPCVVNLSLGTTLGARDGTDPMEEEIDDLVTAQTGRAVVVAAGNEREAAAHAQVKAQQGVGLSKPSFSVPAYNATPGLGNDFVAISGYYGASDSIGVGLVSPNEELYFCNLTATGCCSNPINGPDGTVQICNAQVSNLGQSTTAREIYIQIWDGVANKPPAAGTWNISVSGNSIGGTGEVDFWMASRLGNAEAKFTNWVRQEETLIIPATSHEAIAVGAHVTRRCWEDYNGASHTYSSNPTIGDIAPFSSAGPTRDGRPKPELAAPGMGVISALADEVKAGLIANGYGSMVVNDHYSLLQGTSMAAPHVTGAVALLLEQDPSRTVSELRSLLANGARDDAYTKQYDGVFGWFNFSFGSGKLDLGSWAWGDPFETNDTVTQARATLSGQVREGFIGRADDSDYFALEGVVVGDTIEASLTSLPADYKLRLRGPGLSSPCTTGGVSTKATSDNPGTSDESLVYTAANSLTLARWLLVTSSAGAYEAADSYQLKAVLKRPETASLHTTKDTAQPLPALVEMKVAGAISNGVEPDYYSLSVPTTKTLVLTASGRVVTIKDGNGATVASGFGSVSYQTPPGNFFTTKRTYYALVPSLQLGSYVLTLKIQ